MKANIPVPEKEIDSETFPALYKSRRDGSIVVLFFTNTMGCQIKNGDLVFEKSAWTTCYDNLTWTRMPKGTKIELIQD